MSLRNVLSMILFAGCLVPANNSPRYASQPPSPAPAQPIAQPQSEPQPDWHAEWRSDGQSTQPIYYDEPGYNTISVNIAGESVGNIDVFYDQLDPYGTWYDDPTYGWAFSPSQSSYVPYSNGYWKYTDYGLLWVSNDPFG